jgi:DNA-binding response OmpR family regulator
MSDRKKILVADDDRFMRELLRVILARAGYAVTLAEDGSQALEMATAEKPDLVLCDGLLPKLHGFELCKAIKEFVDAPKVILLTGIYTKPTYKWQVMKDYGADAVLTKPVNDAQLLACIAQQLTTVEQPQLSAVQQTPERTHSNAA